MTPIDFWATRSKVKVRGHICRLTILVSFILEEKVTFVFVDVTVINIVNFQN